MTGPFTAVHAAETTELTEFGDEPIWLVIVKVLAVFAFLMVMVLFAIVFERKVVGRMQTRIGPNRTGPWGTLQSLADAIKLGFKEEIIPVLADKPVYFLAPIVAVVPAFLAFSVIPFGPTVSIAGNQTPLQLTDLPVGVLIIFATSALGVYGIILSGWASGSTYPLLGGMRSAAQVISYEVAMGLSFVAVFLYAESMSTSEVVAAQDDLWFGVPLVVSFLIYAVAVVGETNRAPFDLPEAESELVGGFHTEYSSMKFAMFYLAEYVNMITVSALATTLFLGGWRAPWPLSIWDGANSGWWPLLWFVGKVVLGLFVFIWLRGTLPRLRYDQFMKLGWKVLIPVNLVWIMVVSAFQVLRDRGWETNEMLFVIGIPLVVVLLVLTFWPERRPPSKPTTDERKPPFPVPPMDLVVPPSPRIEVTVGGVQRTDEEGASATDAEAEARDRAGRDRPRPTGRPTTSRTGRRPRSSTDRTDPGKNDV